MHKALVFVSQHYKIYTQANQICEFSCEYWVLIKKNCIYVEGWLKGLIPRDSSRIRAQKKKMEMTKISSKIISGIAIQLLIQLWNYMFYKMIHPFLISFSVYLVILGYSFNSLFVPLSKWSLSLQMFKEMRYLYAVIDIELIPMMKFLCLIKWVAKAMSPFLCVLAFTI